MHKNQAKKRVVLWQCGVQENKEARRRVEEAELNKKAVFTLFTPPSHVNANESQSQFDATLTRILMQRRRFSPPNCRHNSKQGTQEKNHFDGKLRLPSFDVTCTVLSKANLVIITIYGHICYN